MGFAACKASLRNWKFNLGTMSDAVQNEVICKLLPGAGFFGNSDFLRADIPVVAIANEVLLFLECDNPEQLGFAEISFFDEADREIQRETLNARIELSNAGKMKKHAIAKAFLAGELLQTKPQTTPWIDIHLPKPVNLSRICLRNRNDPRRKINCTLRVEVGFDGQCITSWNAGGIAAESILRELCEILAMDAQFVLSGGATRLQILEVLAQRIEAGGFDWDIRKAVQLLPLTLDFPALEACEITLAAWITCQMLGNRKSIGTKTLRDLSNVLHSPAILDALVAKGTQLLRSSGEDTVQLVMAKHRTLSYPVLLTHRDSFLEALDMLFPLLAQEGKQAVLCYGTLLGAVRDKGFIAHDDDVDVLYFDGATSLEDALANRDALIGRLKAAGYRIFGNTKNFHIVINGRALDIFPCWKDGDQLYLLMEQYKIRGIPFELVFPAGEVELYGHSYPAPANPEGFLLERYGEGWAQANPYFEWPWHLSEPVAAPPRIPYAPLDPPKVW